MSTSESQRLALSRFLKKCRARLTPAEAGLPEPDRRRAPGLRREDVASLACVSVTWYTHLEQGRDIKVSAQVLERIAAILKLSAVERDYLFELAHGRPAPLLKNLHEGVTPGIRRTLQALPLPAYVKTVRWDIVAWNDMYSQIFVDLARWPESKRNALKLMFDSQFVGDESFASRFIHDDPEDFEAMVRRVVGKLRMDYSRFPDDRGFEDLIAEMRKTNPLFRTHWDAGEEIASRSDGVWTLRHREAGIIRLAHASYVPEGSTTLRVHIFAPHDEKSAEKLGAMYMKRFFKVKELSLGAA